jgi:hypothetical protein
MDSLTKELWAIGLSGLGKGLKMALMPLMGPYRATLIQ